MLGPVAGVFSDPFAFVSAWANVDGDATPAALRTGSFGVASVTDNGVGDYTLTWTHGKRATPAVLATTQSNGTTSVRHVGIHATTGTTATTARFFTSSSTTAVDQDQFTAAVFGW